MQISNSFDGMYHSQISNNIGVNLSVCAVNRVTSIERHSNLDKQINERYLRSHLAACQGSFAFTILFVSILLQPCGAQQAISNPTVDASPTGLPYLLVALVFGLIFGIPIVLWVHRNYVSHALKYIGVKFASYSTKAYERVSMKVGDAGRKLSERVRI